VIETVSSGICVHASVLKSTVQASIIEHTISTAHVVTQFFLVLLISKINLLLSSKKRSLELLLFPFLLAMIASFTSATFLLNKLEEL
jgi:hypothetical protein